MKTFKCIAPYPKSPYEVGDLVEISPSGTSYLEIVTQEMSQWTDEIQGVDHYSHIDNIKSFPNLFKELDAENDKKQLIIDTAICDYCGYLKPDHEENCIHGLKNSIGMQLQFYTHSGATLEDTIDRIYKKCMTYLEEKIKYIK